MFAGRAMESLENLWEPVGNLCGKSNKIIWGEWYLGGAWGVFLAAFGSPRNYFGGHGVLLFSFRIILCFRSKTGISFRSRFRITIRFRIICRFMFRYNITLRFRFRFGSRFRFEMKL